MSTRDPDKALRVHFWADTAAAAVLVVAGFLAAGTYDSGFSDYSVGQVLRYVMLSLAAAALAHGVVLVAVAVDAEPDPDPEPGPRT